MLSKNIVHLYYERKVNSLFVTRRLRMTLHERVHVLYVSYLNVLVPFNVTTRTRTHAYTHIHTIWMIFEIKDWNNAFPSD